MTRDHRRKLAGAAAAVAGLSIALGPLAIMSAAAVTTTGAAAVTPVTETAPQASSCAAPGYAHCLRYSFTGDDQSFTVPAGVTKISVLLWGAGGGGASSSNGQFTAGAGGYTTGDVAVHPGQHFTVTAGQGGSASGTNYSVYGYGGGGLGGNGMHTGGAGGGLSALWDGPYGSDPVLIAGGGGGATPDAPHGADGNYTATVGGGGGGGLNGGSDKSGYSGGGGTQDYAGAAGSPPVVCLGSGSGGTAPGGGMQYTGGNGAGSDPSPPGLGEIADGGGGGGGGYYGGGGGRCQVRNTDFPNGAGGGGSGFIGGPGVGDPFTVAGDNATDVAMNTGAPPAAEAMGNPLYVPGLSWGGGPSGSAAGGNGQVVIEWGPKTTPKPHHSPTPPPPTPKPAPPGPPLPVTGFPFAQFGTAGLLLILIGSAVTWAARRPRRLS
jgi:hypothetical protein